LEALAKDKTLQSASALKLSLLTTINTKLIRYLDVMKDVDAAKYADFAAAVAQGQMIHVKIASSRISPFPVT